MSRNDFITDLFEMAKVDGTPLEVVNEAYNRAKGLNPNPPKTVKTGDIWVRNEETGETYVWSGTDWVLTS